MNTHLFCRVRLHLLAMNIITKLGCFTLYFMYSFFVTESARECSEDIQMWQLQSSGYTSWSEKRESFD